MRATWDVLPEFRTWRVGPFLAYNVGTKGHLGWQMLFEALKQVPKNGKVLLVFGEIDCRAHLVKQRDKQGRTLDDLATECAKSYFRAVSAVRDMGHEMMVFGGMPTGCRGYISEVDGKGYQFAYYGTEHDRNEAARAFDSSVKKECKEAGIRFLSILDKLVDQKGETIHGYFLDGVHLSQKALPLIKEALNEDEAQKPAQEA